MTEPTESRPVPLLGDISLEYGQRVEHTLDAGFVSLPVAGLDGALQQRLSRRGHRIHIAGYLFGDEALDALKTLQLAAAEGAELTFSADISSALDLQQVVITEFWALERAGQPDRFSYELELIESPPLPPPAQTSAFGGLDEFGLGDLSFDTDILGDLEDLAGDIASAVDQALDIVDQLGALSNLDGLSLGGLLQPLEAPTDGARDAAGDLSAAADALRGAFS